MDTNTLQADAAAAATPTDDGLAEVSELALRQMRLEDKIEDLTADLSKANEELRHVANELLPAALHSHNLSEIKMADGSQVSIKDIVKASIPKALQDLAFGWLYANGHGDLIKHVVSASFGRGEDAFATAAVELLKNAGARPEDKRTVHPQTLSAFVREQIEAGISIPHETLGVYIGEVTKIKRPKVRAK